MYTAILRDLSLPLAPLRSRRRGNMQRRFSCGSDIPLILTAMPSSYGVLSGYKACLIMAFCLVVKTRKQFYMWEICVPVIVSHAYNDTGLPWRCGRILGADMATALSANSCADLAGLARQGIPGRQSPNARAPKPQISYLHYSTRQTTTALSAMHSKGGRVLVGRNGFARPSDSRLCARYMG